MSQKFFYLANEVSLTLELKVTETIVENLWPTKDDGFYSHLVVWLGGVG